MCSVEYSIVYLLTSMIPNGEIPLGERAIIRIVSHLRQIVGKSFGSMSRIVSVRRICKVFLSILLVCKFAGITYHIIIKNIALF